MPLPPDHVLHEITRHGGERSARVLAGLLREYLQPEVPPLGEAPPLDARLDRLADALGRQSRTAIGGEAFNVIPASGQPGVCCPLVVALAGGGFGAASSARRPNFNQIALLLAGHWLRCQPANAETLILTPDWNQQAFDRRFADLLTAYHDTGKRAFIVEFARTGLILRWPY